MFTEDALKDFSDEWKENNVTTDISKIAPIKVLLSFFFIIKDLLAYKVNKKHFRASMIS